MTGHATSFIDQNIFYNIAQDPNINSPEFIFRPEDPNFGMKKNYIVVELYTETMA